MMEEWREVEPLHPAPHGLKWKWYDGDLLGYANSYIIVATRSTAGGETFRIQLPVSREFAEMDVLPSVFLDEFERQMRETPRERGWRDE